MSVFVLHGVDSVVSASNVLAAVPMAAGGGGILDWINAKSTEAVITIRIVAGVVALAFVVGNAWRSKGALGAIVVSLLVAGIFMWGVIHMTEIQDRVGNEMAMGSGPVSAHVIDAPAVPVATSLAFV